VRAAPTAAPQILATDRYMVEVPVKSKAEMINEYLEIKKRQA